MRRCFLPTTARKIASHMLRPDNRPKASLRLDEQLSQLSGRRVLYAERGRSQIDSPGLRHRLPLPGRGLNTRGTRTGRIAFEIRFSVGDDKPLDFQVIHAGQFVDQAEHRKAHFYWT